MSYRRRREYVAVAVGCAAMLTCLGPMRGRAVSPAGPASATAPAASSPCASDGELASSAHRLLECEQATITALQRSTCYRPIHVVFVMPDAALDVDWMARTALGALDALADAALRYDAVAVVRYGVRAEAVLELTPELARARPRLSEGSPGGSAGDPEEAARTALAALRASGSLVEPQSLMSRDIAVFYVTAKLGQRDLVESILRARELLDRANVALLVGCPAPRGAHELCGGARLMAHDAQDFFEPPSLKPLAIRMGQMLDGFAAEDTIVNATLRTRLPLGLEYVDGSAQLTPLQVSRSITGTEVTWEWTAGLSGW